MSRTLPSDRTTSGRPRRPRTRTTLSGAALAVLSPLALEYVVQPGDTVSEIAAEHGTTVGRVVEANDLPAGGDEIYAGEVLRLPAAHRAGHEPVADGGGTADDGRRRIEWHRVQPGDTMTEIAERYHAWTDELVAANGGSEYLQVGEMVKVPVVVAAAQSDSSDAGSSGTRVGRLRAALSEHPDPSRAKVRRLIVETSRDYGVDPQLALAVSWQEAGWQQHHVSPDAAIGAMQVIPATGAWVEDTVGEDLDLLHVRDNVTAGVALLDQLTEAAHTRRAVAGYYQGLAGVRAHGMYDETKAYVANVLALKRSFERGDYPG